MVFGLPFHDDNYASTYVVSGRPILPSAQRARAGLRVVSEDYFRVMRIKLLEGRVFEATDRADTQHVCIVNQSLARQEFAERSAIGHVLLRGKDADQAFEIVGVIGDVKTNGLQNPTRGEIFYPFRQLPRQTAALVARTAADPDALGAVFQAAVAAVDTDVPVFRFASMRRRLTASLGSERLMASLTSAFATVALVMAVVGLYAVLAHSVTSRTMEIGLRMALGADRNRILRLIVRQGMTLVVSGLACGLVAALAMSRWLSAYLFDVSSHDVSVYGLVAGIFAVAGAASSVVPALQAARLESSRLAHGDGGDEFAARNRARGGVVNSECFLVVFDLAGTTVQEDGIVSDALKAALTGQQVHVTDAQIARVRGFSKREAIFQLLPDDASRSERARETYATFRHELMSAIRAHGVEAIKGAERTFVALKSRGVRVGNEYRVRPRITSAVLHAVGLGIPISLMPSCGATTCGGGGRRRLQSSCDGEDGRADAADGRQCGRHHHQPGSRETPVTAGEIETLSAAEAAAVGRWRRRRPLW